MAMNGIMEGACQTRPRRRPNSTPIPISDLEQFIIDENDGDVKLHIAAYNGDLNSLQNLISRYRREVNRRVRPFGSTPLRLAATNNHPACVEFLLNNGALVDMVDFKAQTPLFIAIQKQNYACAKFLLEAGANANGDIGNRCSTLYVAARDGFLEGIKLLLSYDADPELEDRLLGIVPGLPLHTAAIYHHFECFAALLLGGALSDLRKSQTSLPNNVICLLSLSHTLVKHRCSIQFGKLFIEFGGNLWQQDKNKLLSTELAQDCGIKLFFKQKLGLPLTLRSLCRLQIRSHLGRQKLKLIPFLPLPKTLLDFIHYRDLIPDADKLLCYSYPNR